MPSFAVLDTETTGLLPSHDRVVEIAVVGLRPDGSMEWTWSTLLNPQRDLGPQHIHGIHTADVLAAPAFADIAGDLMELLQNRVVVGHNVSFDARFVTAEYARTGVGAGIDSANCLCTRQLARSLLPERGGTLNACCVQAGVTHHDQHSALGDATATANLLQALAARAGGMDVLGGRLGLDARVASAPWPPIPARRTRTVQRGNHGAHTQHYLERLTESLPSLPGDDAVQAYLTSLELALLDRVLSAREADALVSLARDLGIDRHTARWINNVYLTELVHAAWSDGTMTSAELDDIRLVGRLLALPPEHVERLIADSDLSRGPASEDHPEPSSAFGLDAGDLVVFTGDMSRPREELEEMARSAGLAPHSGVTKKVRLLVAADPDSLSAKARKAVDYGIPIVTEAGFMRLLASAGRSDWMSDH